MKHHFYNLEDIYNQEFKTVILSGSHRNGEYRYNYQVFIVTTLTPEGPLVKFKLTGGDLFDDEYYDTLEAVFERFISIVD